MKPELQEFAENNGWHATVGVVNIDNQPKLTARFKINAVPKLLVFRDGKLVDEIVGYDQNLKIGEVVFKK